MATRRDELSDGKTAVPDHADTSIGGVVELVKGYARQETLDPLRGAGRYLGFGALGALLVGLGGSLLLLGLLRLLQSEFDQRLARGALSWAAYLCVLVVCGAGIALALSRINRSSLNPSDERREQD